MCLCSTLWAQDTREVLDRAANDLRQGRVEASLREFAEVIRREPSAAPHLWQLGIAQYYAGQHKQCAAQFESHRTVNPADVENAAWHFLCVAGQVSAAEAKRRLLPVGVDERRPMQQIYAMFRGEQSPDAVLRAAGSEASALFYAHLYIGLWHEAYRRSSEALTHLKQAAEPRYAAFGGYMHDLARLHVRLRGR